MIVRDCCAGFGPNDPDTFNVVKRGETVMTFRGRDVLEVAKAFHFNIRTALAPVDLEAVDLQNAKGPDFHCATQDYLDANEDMAYAFEHALGREPDVGDEADAAIWNKAWAVAIAVGFSHEWE